MIRNYLKPAQRSLARPSHYPAINMFGLVVGMAAFLLIMLVVQFELSFDDFHKNKDRIYRLVSVPFDGSDFNPGSAPYPYQ